MNNSLSPQCKDIVPVMAFAALSPSTLITMFTKFDRVTLNSSSGFQIERLVNIKEFIARIKTELKQFVPDSVMESRKKVL